MPKVNGIDAARQIRALNPATKILMLTVSDDEEDLYEAIKAGANGYLLKEISVEEVAEAIRAVVQGQSLISPSMASKLLNEFNVLARKAEERQQYPTPALTTRELEVLKLVAKGMSNREIADALYISENTVKNHVRNILEKLHLHSRMEAVIYAVRERLLDIRGSADSRGVGRTGRLVPRMSIFTKILRAGEGKKVRAPAKPGPDINALEPEFERLSDDDLAYKTVEFRERLENGEDLNDLLVEAFAVMREAAKRAIGQRHFDVQLMGGAALHFGWIAEMKTGEGKTLVSTLPVYLNALGGEGVHLVTVNDYLARFHADWMGKVYRMLGITVGRVSPEIDDWQAKKDAYNSDVTYGTNTEFGFDYLRDNMARSLEHMVQRGHAFAIVDEVDSILIDEARTPLIISGPATDSLRLYYQFAGVARSLTRDVDYEVDEEKRTVAPTEDGIAKVERQLGVDNLYDIVAANLSIS